jgi:hypothetical protein
VFNVFQQIDLYAQLIKSIPFFFRSSKSRDPYDLLAQKNSVRMTGINTEISTAISFYTAWSNASCSENPSMSSDMISSRTSLIETGYRVLLSL